jgi:hypothetical protein
MYFPAENPDEAIWLFKLAAEKGKRHSRHEWLAPVRLSIGPEIGSDLLLAEFWPDIGSIGLSFSGPRSAGGRRPWQSKLAVAEHDELLRFCNIGAPDR